MSISLQKSGRLLTFNLVLLRKYLSDPIEDVRVATETLLGEFLREIQDVTVVRKRNEERLKSKKDKDLVEPARRSEHTQDNLLDVVLTHSERAAFISEYDGVFDRGTESALKEESHSEADGHDTGGKAHPIR